jgi:hypothetical protein
VRDLSSAFLLIINLFFRKDIIMKKIILLLVATVFIGVALYSVESSAHMSQGYGYGMGPGMMGQGYGYGMGPGMMGPGYGMGPRYGYGQQYGPQYGRQYQQFQKPLNRNQAKQEVENYLNSMRNPNLKLGEIEEKGNNYQINIETKNGSLVDKILVDKNTGWMRSAY